MLAYAASHAFVRAAGSAIAAALARIAIDAIRHSGSCGVCAQTAHCTQLACGCVSPRPARSAIIVIIVVISVCRGGVPSLHRVPGCIARTLASGAVLALLSAARIYLSGCAQNARRLTHSALVLAALANPAVIRRILACIWAVFTRRTIVAGGIVGSIVLPSRAVDAAGRAGGRVFAVAALLARRTCSRASSRRAVLTAVPNVYFGPLPNDFSRSKLSVGLTCCRSFVLRGKWHRQREREHLRFQLRGVETRSSWAHHSRA